MNLNIKDTKQNNITLKKYYFDEIKNKKLTRIFRPENRTCPNNKCYFNFQKVFIKILKIQGSDYHKINPIHENFKFPVQITSSICKKLINLENKDFLNCGNDINNIKSLKIHLALIYNLEKKTLENKKFEITITDFKYL